jgi:hypothetical protein
MLKNMDFSIYNKDNFFNIIQEEIKKILISSEYKFSLEQAEELNNDMIMENPIEIKKLLDKGGDIEKIAREIIEKSLERTINNVDDKKNNKLNNSLIGDRGLNTMESLMLDEAGINSFKIFLNIINSENLFFIKRNYLNTGEYFYFFFTEKINSNLEILDKFEEKRSLKKGFDTLSKIKDKKLNFFFGIKESILEYGFLDNDKFVVYKIGSFLINQNYIENKLPKYKCMINIRNRMKDANLKNIKLLHSVKKDLSELFPNVNSNIKILDEFRIRKTFEKSIFKKDDIDENKKKFMKLKKVS